MPSCPVVVVRKFEYLRKMAKGKKFNHRQERKLNQGVTMRWTVKFAGLSAAAAFTCVPRIVSNVPQRVAFTTYGQGVVVRQAVAWEDLNDKLIAQNAPLLLDYLSHPDDLVNQPPNFAALDPSEKLALLEQNYKNLVSNAGPS